MRLFILFILFSAHAAHAQVGIGTTNPSSNSVLDLTSPDKGLLLPRVNDTSTVNNPSEGLMIYDQNHQSLAFHNGNRWNALASISDMIGASGDSITYSFFGPNSFEQGIFKVIAISFGGSNLGPTTGVNLQDVSFAKPQDINSVNFLKEMILSALNGGIEFKIYKSGEPTPYYSVKLSNFYISSVSQAAYVGGETSENVSISYEIIGFKDWINDNGFSYNLQTNVIGPY